MFTLKMLIRSNIWIRLKHISSTLSTSQGPFLTNWRWAPSSVWSPHFDLHVTFTFSFWGLIANNFFVLLHESHFHSLFLRTISFVSFCGGLTWNISAILVLRLWFYYINVPIEYPNLNVSFILPRWQEVSSFLSFRNAFSSSVKLQASKICTSTCIQILLHVTKWAKIKDNR